MRNCRQLTFKMKRIRSSTASSGCSSYLLTQSATATFVAVRFLTAATRMLAKYRDRTTINVPNNEASSSSSDSSFFFFPLFFVPASFPFVFFAASFFFLPCDDAGELFLPFAEAGVVAFLLRGFSEPFAFSFAALDVFLFFGVLTW